jgi:hypothetical protein
MTHIQAATQFSVLGEIQLLTMKKIRFEILFNKNSFLFISILLLHVDSMTNIHVILSSIIFKFHDINNLSTISYYYLIFASFFVGLL